MVFLCPERKNQQKQLREERERERRELQEAEENENPYAEEKAACIGLLAYLRTLQPKEEDSRTRKQTQSIVHQFE